MTGLAHFRAGPVGILAYEETGALLLPGQGEKLFQFSRRYLYRFTAGGLTIYFDEAVPRLFEKVEPQGGPLAWHAKGTHDCAPDRYTSCYRFSIEDGFHFTHDVRGPSKDYRIETALRRVPAA
jgi:hypothetical protein